MSFDPAGDRKSIWYRRDQDGLKPTARSLPRTLEGGALMSSVLPYLSVSGNICTVSTEVQASSRPTDDYPRSFGASHRFR